MKPQEIEEVKNTADEHFEGDIKMAAAAHVFGLGVVKMKKGIPGHASRKERDQVREIAAQVESTAPPKTARGSKAKPKAKTK
jgi:hypothetical protein